MSNFFSSGWSVFVAVAKVGARRYRLTRTSWRGIRFAFHGSVPALVRIVLAQPQAERGEAHDQNAWRQHP